MTSPVVIRRFNDRQLSIFLFIGLLVVYFSNGDFLPGDDATGNIMTPVHILTRGNATFTPEEFPYMFRWTRANDDLDMEEISTVGWRIENRNWLKSRGYTMSEITLKGPKYYLKETTNTGEYISIFGIGAPLSSLPLFALAGLFVDLEETTIHTLWYLGKMTASLAVAGSAVFLFLTLRQFMKSNVSLGLTAIYGVGTSVWSISSQTLWQHGPNVLFISATLFFWLKPEKRSMDWLLCGASVGFAVLCRPTSGLLVIILCFWLIFENRKALGQVILGGIPFALILVSYNQFYMGSLWTFGQTEQGESIALAKTGSMELWQTPLLEGLLGLLISPSRGLFIYSPFLLLAIPGIWKIWTVPDFRSLRPWTLASLAMLLLAAKWFDWWGGWAYGYRPIVDTMPLWICFLAVGWEWIQRNPVRQYIFAWLVAYAVAVQFMGAFAYDLGSWNNRNGQNIDSPENRHRLWSIRDNQISYLFLNFPDCRKRKQYNTSM